MAKAEAYLHAKFHLDPSNRLATVHERHRQDRQTTVQLDRVNRFTNGRPKIVQKVHIDVDGRNRDFVHPCWVTQCSLVLCHMPCNRQFLDVTVADDVVPHSCQVSTSDVGS